MKLSFSSFSFLGSFQDSLSTRFLRVSGVQLVAFSLLFSLLVMPCRADVTWDCEYWLAHWSDIEDLEREFLDLREKLWKNSWSGARYFQISLEIQKVIAKLRSRRIEVNLDIEQEDIGKILGN